MSRWDDALRQALRREEPPEGFAARVMRRVSAEAPPAPVQPGLADRLRNAFRLPRLRWATAFAAVALAVGAVQYRDALERRAQGERARDQVMMALRITGDKLRMTQAMVRRINYAPREQ